MELRERHKYSIQHNLADLSVAMVSCQQMISGIGRYSVELLRNMQAFIPNTVLYYPESSNPPAFAGLQPYHHRSFRRLRPYVLPLYIKSGISSSRADVYHAHWFLSGLATTMKPGRRIVITMHDVSLLHIDEAKGNLYSKYYRWSIERFKKLGIPLIVVSENAKRDTLMYSDYPEHLVHVVYNGINQEQFFPLPKQQGNAFRIIYSGGLGKRKRIDLLLKAFKLVQEKFKDVELHISGAYPENTFYPELAKKLGLNQVFFTGFIAEEKMNEFYNSGSLFVYTSDYEGFGFAPLEAMAAGLPVVSTTGGSLNEILNDAALRVESSETDVAEKIEYLITNSFEREKLVVKGLQHVKNFSWRKSVSETAKVYSSVL